MKKYVDQLHSLECVHTDKLHKNTLRPPNFKVYESSNNFVSVSDILLKILKGPIRPDSIGLTVGMLCCTIAYRSWFGHPPLL